MFKFSFSNLGDRFFSYQFPAQIRTASNLIANVYSLLVGIVFVPLYINYIGIEAYGIIGAFNGITAFLWLFDFGIATNINRELAKFYDQKDKHDSLDVKKTLEIVCYGLAGSIFLFLLGFTAFLAFYWFNTDRFTPSFLFSVLLILAFSLALQFPVVFYSSGLLGLNQQVSLNIITVVINTIKCLGAFIAVIYFDDKIRAFLIVQMIVVILQLLILKTVLARFIRADGYKGKFKFEILKRLKKFTSELFANNLVIILLTQSDKIILSKILTLEEFGFYMLAYSISVMAIGTFSSSIVNVAFPNFSRLVAQKNEKDLTKNYRLSSQLMAWGAISIITVLVFFSQEILQIWSRNSAVAEKTSILLSIYVLGFGINVITLIPYHLQLAFGTSRISFLFNLVSLLFYVPALIVSSYYYGAVGAVSCWLILCVINFFTFVPMIHLRFLSFSLKDWYFKDVGKPLLVGPVIGFIFWFLIPSNLSSLSLFILIGICFFSVAGVAFIVTDLPKYAVNYNVFGKLKDKLLKNKI